jgi:hypothetical protein
MIVVLGMWLEYGNKESKQNLAGKLVRKCSLVRPRRKGDDTLSWVIWRLAVRIGSVWCTVAGFNISEVEPSGSATVVLFNLFMYRVIK